MPRGARRTFSRWRCLQLEACVGRSEAVPRQARARLEWSISGRPAPPDVLQHTGSGVLRLAGLPQRTTTAALRRRPSLSVFAHRRGPAGTWAVRVSRALESLPCRVSRWHPWIVDNTTRPSRSVYVGCASSGGLIAASTLKFQGQIVVSSRSMPVKRAPFNFAPVKSAPCTEAPSRFAAGSSSSESGPKSAF